MEFVGFEKSVMVIKSLIFLILLNSGKIFTVFMKFKPKCPVKGREYFVQEGAPLMIHKGGKVLKGLVLGASFSLLLPVLLLAIPGSESSGLPDSGTNYAETGHGTGPIERQYELFKKYDPKGYYADISIANPLNESLFPSNIAAPVFEWTDNASDADGWIIEIRFEKGSSDPIYAQCTGTRWEPGKEVWNLIKQHTVESYANITILGYRKGAETEILSKGMVRISTSRDPVDAPVLFRRVPPSFSYASRHPEVMEWCLADVSSYDEPPVIMSRQPVCGSCHTFSRNGTLLGMDMDFQGDKGSYFLKRPSENMILKTEDFISWNDFPREDGLGTTSLFSRVSPDGNFVASTVNDISFLAKTSDPYHSQHFFPIQGRLAVYSTKTHSISGLDTGEQRREVVDTDPSWSPDGRKLIFARAVMERNLYRELGGETIFSAGDESVEGLYKKYPVQFNIYRMLFNSGKGSVARPLTGASNNGMSNYYARYSPDGRWIVFTRSKTGLVIQPDSKLYIVSSEGGDARLMRCNRGYVNSWHTWSPNGRWLAFVSKERMPYAELFLTHVDEDGNDSVPVRLTRFNKPGFAINVPEFAPIEPGSIKSMSLESGVP